MHMNAFRMADTRNEKTYDPPMPSHTLGWSAESMMDGMFTRYNNLAHLDAVSHNLYPQKID